MERINIFVKKGEYFNLTDSSKGNLTMFNPPMYNTDINLYKGIENKVQFSVRDNDRKAYRLRDKELFFTLINQKLHTKLVKKLWCMDAYKGIYELTISEKEMKDLEPMTYQASVVYKDLEGDETMLYSSINYDPVFNVKVNEGFRDTVIPSIELNPENFLHNYYTSKVDGNRYDYYVSSRIKADNSDIHTVAVTVKNNFLGSITMYGSLEPDPQDTENDWFEIVSKEYDDETKVDSETFGWNVEHNLLWVRFGYTVKAANGDGKIDSIIYRN